MQTFKSIVYSILFLVAGVVLIGYGAKEHSILTSKPVDVADYDCDWTKLDKNDHVKSDLNFILDEVYNETTTETNYGVKTKEYESGRAYLVAHLTENKRGYLDIDYVTSVFVKNKDDYSKIEKVINDSWEFIYGERYDLDDHYYRVNGKMVPLSYEEKKYIREDLICLGYSASEIGDKIIDYKIVPANDPFVVCLVIGLFLILVGVIFILMVVVSKKKAKKEAEMAAMYRGTVTSYDQPIDELSSNVAGNNYNPETGSYNNQGSNLSGISKDNM